MNKKLLVSILLPVLSLVVLSACGVVAIEEPSEIQTLNATIAVDPCENVVNCVKVIVSERSDGSKSAFVGGQGGEYEVTFSSEYNVTANTTVGLTESDYAFVPTIDGCVSVNWTIEGTSEQTTIDVTYVFSC